MSDLGFSAIGLRLAITIWVFTILCLILIVLRFLAVKITKRRVFADDYLVALAYVSMNSLSTSRPRFINLRYLNVKANTVALGGCAMWGVYNGMGHHTTKLSQTQLEVLYKVSTH